jgi:hypothetical protein
MLDVSVECNEFITCKFSLFLHDYIFVNFYFVKIGSNNSLMYVPEGCSLAEGL